MTITYSSAFERSYKKCSENIMWSFSITESYRIIFTFTSDQFTFIDIGDHQIYQ